MTQSKSVITSTIAAILACSVEPRAKANHCMMYPHVPFAYNNSTVKNEYNRDTMIQ